MEAPQTVLKPLNSARIVAAGNHHGAIGLQVEDRIIEHRGGHHADIDHVAAAGLQPAQISAFRKRGELRRVSRPRLILLALMALQVGAEGAAELLDIVVQQLDVGCAADVVLAKNRRFEHWRFVLNIPWR